MNSNKFIVMALTEMFRRVGRTYQEEAVSEKDWFKETTWTTRQQEEFQFWLAEKFRRRGSRTSKAIFQAGMFILYFGWVIDDQVKPKPKYNRPTLEDRLNQKPTSRVAARGRLQGDEKKA